MIENIINNQNEIIKEFSKLEDCFDKYKYLISLGKKLKSSNKKLKTEENAISGCQSQVWLKAYNKNGRIQYIADSDSKIVKGIIYLLLKTFNNQYPKDIVNADIFFIDKIGLNSNLSPSRVNGLMTILKKIKTYAQLADNNINNTKL